VCGVGAYISLAGDGVVTLEQLRPLATAQSHRGPDAEGLWLSEDQRVGLAHRRLAIIDVDPRADQPMVSADGTTALSFNGEIYNYREVRADLIGRGWQFSTTSDTEVVLAGYATWGVEVLSRLRGMFAFVLVDRRTDVALMVRDALGIKPLYYRLTADAIIAASEIGALAPYGRTDIDDTSVVELLTWGSIAPPRTIYQAIRAIPAGAYGIVEHGRFHLRTWADPIAMLSSNDGDQVVDAAQAIRESVRVHLESDVPVGAFLSAGVDSSTLVSLMAEITDRDVTAVTVSNAQDDESEAAGRFAASLGIRHVVVSFDDVTTRDLVPRAVAALDQPSVDGINAFVVARAAADTGLKVAVSGVGGDELFGGYATFSSIPRLMRIRERTPRGAWSAMQRAFPKPDLVAKSTRRGQLAWAAHYLSARSGPYLLARGLFAPHHVSKLCGVATSDVIALADERVGSSLPGDPIDATTDLECRQYLQTQLLRDTDAASMRSSLEVRTPLVDAKLYSDLSRLPTADRTRGPAKKLLRSAPSRQLPDEVFRTPKRGFSLPFDEWIRTSTIQLERPRHSMFDREQVDRVFDQHREGRCHWSRPWLLHVMAHWTG
jgi:asparagine synthase (glutamine-hydrolysing)